METKATDAKHPKPRSKFHKWFLEGQPEHTSGLSETEEHSHKHKATFWLAVMCLTGVDYFSTLAYQPSIAYNAVGPLAPLATIVLVLLTLFGAFPVYTVVAQESPHGQGSISMLQRLLSYWKSKIAVLILLGFAATDFIITITLSAADATEHLVSNGLVTNTLKWHLHGSEVIITCLMIISLCLVIMKGLKEAVGVAVVLVIAFLSLNGLVILDGIQRIIANPELISHWKSALQNPASYPAELHLGKLKSLGGFLLLGITLVQFPKLALGLSGFETGVAVMPLVKGDRHDSHEKPAGRIRNTRNLLLTAAVIMSLFLLSSSFVTAILIPPNQILEGGAAFNRAIAFLAYAHFGNTFGVVYDAVTILILWFAGASAMAGLLNLVPRYLPRFGMAPEWARANRPLVLVFTVISIFVTILFKASVEAQGGAYATGVLVLMCSAGVAATIAVSRKGRKGLRWAFGLITLVFFYTTLANIYEKPTGIVIATYFVVSILLISFISRIWRTLELRVDSVELDLNAVGFVRAAAASGKIIRLIPNRPEAQDEEEYERKETETRRDHDIGEDEDVIFVEIYVGDASNFTGNLKVRGSQVGPHKVLRATGVAVPNSLAALMLHLRKLTGKRPHAYFNWGERGPIQYILKFFVSGQGDIAPLTREILRRVEPDANERPVIHAAS